MGDVTGCSEVLISGSNISAICRRAKTNQAPGWEAATRHPLTHFTRPQWAPHMTAPRSCGVSASHNFSGAFNPTRIRKVFHQHKEWTADSAPSCHDSVLKLTRIPQLFRTSLFVKLASWVDAPRPGERDLWPGVTGLRGEPPLFPLTGRWGEVLLARGTRPDSAQPPPLAKRSALFGAGARPQHGSTGSNPAWWERSLNWHC